MSKEEKKVIKRDNWTSSFTLVGKPIINSDYTFTLDKKSEKSDWVYNSLNLGIDCGEKFGVVYVDCIGGYGEDRDTVIYAHGKNEDGTDNFDEQIIVDWEDRLNEDILEKIGDLSFITVGLEKTDKGKVFYKKFLSEYDAIAYMKKYLTEDMVVTVRGNLNYSEYNGNTQVKKNITSIRLNESAKEPSDFFAHFTQSILIDKYSASLKNIDKDKSVMYVDALVLDYLKEKNGVEIRSQYPFKKQFEFELDLTNQEQCKKIMDKLFKVKKGYTQITFVGDLIEGGAVTTVTIDEVPDDIKDLIGVIYTEEEALEQCSKNGSREKRMVLRKPYIKLVGDEKTPVLQRFENKYEEEDLVFDLGDSEEEVPFDADNSEVESTDVGDGLDWLNSL